MKVLFRLRLFILPYLLDHRKLKIPFNYIHLYMNTGLAIDITNDVTGSGGQGGSQ